MQELLPFDPPPPPPPPDDTHGQWPADARWGPPPWPPAPAALWESPQWQSPQWLAQEWPAPRRRGSWQRALLASVAIIAVGFGGGATAWLLTRGTASSTPLAQSPANPTAPGFGSRGNGGAAAPSGSGASGSSGGSASSSAVSAVDAAVVDINATLAGSSGEVAGTGMIISSSGEVLTNNHVIDGTSSITVQIDGAGPTYTATVIGDDPTEDVALLQIHGVSGLPTVPIGNSSQVAVGDQVTAIGNAGGRGGTPAEASGVVSALNQTVTASDESGNSETLFQMFQVTASIEPGDSGGPEISAAGKVIAMTTAGSQAGGPGQASASVTGFAIPIARAMSIVSEIRSGGGPNIHLGNGPLIGVEVSGQGAGGAHVVGVQAGGPGAGAGIVAGDVITHIGSRSIASASDLHTAMRSFSSGQRVAVTWLDTAGAQHIATIQLASGPPL